MNVGSRVVELLIEYGIKHVFGVPGGQTLALYQGIMESSGRIEHVLMRDERSAGYAADAYARITGLTGVCDATVGPGATNLVSPLAEAYSASIPVIAIISDIPRAWNHRRVRGNASQALKQIEIFTTVSKWQTTLTDPNAVNDTIDTAFRIANTGRSGPVVVCIPDDVFNSDVTVAGHSSSSRRANFPRHRFLPDANSIQQAVNLIYKSRKPALLAGGGALTSGATSEIRNLSERLVAPVATTMSGKGVLEDTHYLSIGVAGSMGKPIANDILAEADLVIFIGTKTGQLGTFGWDIPGPGVSTIHIDTDAEEVGRNYSESLPLIGDARLTISALIEALPEEPVDTLWQCEDISKRLRCWYENAVIKPQKENEPLKPPVVMHRLNRFIDDQDLLVCDASLASGWVSVYSPVLQAGRRYLAPRGLAGLGWGLPAAIGAALATNRENRILLFAGDGGFSFSVQELEVMVRLGLPVVSIVFNNDTLAWIKHVERKRFKGSYISTDFNHVDFSIVAQGFGARGYTVSTLDDLSAALEQERHPQGPAVIDVITDQWETPVLRDSSLSLGVTKDH